jgi:AraC-like DNA-binding protein
MTFYQQELQRLHEILYPKDYLLTQVKLGKRFIEQEYARPIQLDDMARAAMISKFHFARLFKQYYGHTPNRYLTQVRIAQAKRLLRTGMHVADVCTSVGFESVGTFTSLFKRETGKTPSACRLRTN